MTKFLNKDNNNKGFTLVELLVAATIFSIIITSATGIFVSALRVQRYILNYQQLLNQTSYAMEYMSRSLRMAKKSDGTVCSDFSGKNYNTTASSIEFVNSNNGECWKFFLASGQLKINKNGDIYNLTSDNLNVRSFNVLVSGDTPNNQPRVIIFLDAEGKKVQSHSPKIKIQTTISQRNINI